MPRSLPPRPSLEHLKKQAKDLVKAHKRKDKSVCDIFRSLKRFAECSAQEIFKAPITLSNAQLALATDYGFESWTALRKAVLDSNESKGNR